MAHHDFCRDPICSECEPEAHANWVRTNELIRAAEKKILKKKRLPRKGPVLIHKGFRERATGRVRVLDCGVKKPIAYYWKDVTCPHCQGYLMNKRGLLV